MGIRIVVREGEPISEALGRLEERSERTGSAREARRRVYTADLTQQRRAKRFQKRFKARQATFLAQRAGEQPVASLAEAAVRFWARTGKP